MMVLFLLGSFAMGAVGRRIAGGGFQDVTGMDIGDLPVRLFFGVMLASAAALGGITNIWQGVAFVIATWLGAITGNFGGLGLGRSATDNYWRSFAGLSLHGLLTGLPLTAVFVVGAGVHHHWTYAALIHSVGHSWGIMVASLLIAPLYEVGWRCSWVGLKGVVPNPTQWHLPKWWPNVIGGGSALGEFLWGGALGVGMCVTALCQ